MCLYSVPGPVGSVSSIMDTTWAVISWSVPSYIPLKYPIINYEIEYYHLNDKCCFMADVDDFNIQVLIHSNVSSDSTFINITGLSDTTCYIFGVRAYTINGPGNWGIIANETLAQSTNTGIALCIDKILTVYFHCPLMICNMSMFFLYRSCRIRQCHWTGCSEWIIIGFTFN